MLCRLGYVGISLSIEATSNRGTVLRNATPERLRELIHTNLAGLRSILEFNAARRVSMFRISSQVIPFGGHPVNTVRWWEEFAPELAGIGALVRSFEMRVSMHPGQYTVLSSADEAISAAAIADLIWHARFLDALGLDEQHKLVIHGGGAYGNKPAAMARWAARFQALPAAIQRRLVVENDERVYSTRDVLTLSSATGVPVVLDVLHHRLHPGDRDLPLGEALAAAFATWRPADGLPKVHFSSQATGLRAGAHAEYVDEEEFCAFLAEAPDQPFDCMLETKAKDLALFRLRDALMARGIAEANCVAQATPPVAGLRGVPAIG